MIVTQLMKRSIFILAYHKTSATDVYFFLMLTEKKKISTASGLVLAIR